MTDTSQNEISEFLIPASREEDIREAIAYFRTLSVLNENKAKITVNRETAAFACAIHALDTNLVLEKYGGIAHILQLAQADKSGMLLRLPCPVGTPYYRIERDCPQCSHYDGCGIGDTYCSISEDSANHEFDSVLVARCPMRFTVEEYHFDLACFSPKQWEHEFGKSIFLDESNAKARADELNNSRHSNL